MFHGSMSNDFNESSTPSTNEIMVYVVDDDYDVRRSLRFLLEMDNFQVRTFSSAEFLLGFEDRDRADCLIIDYKMQPMNGLELTKRLRDLNINTPVILITGFPDARLKDKADALGISMVLIKPHLDENIAANVRYALRPPPS